MKNIGVRTRDNIEWVIDDLTIAAEALQDALRMAGSPSKRAGTLRLSLRRHARPLSRHSRAVVKLAHTITQPDGPPLPQMCRPRP